MDTQEAINRVQAVRNAIILFNQGRGEKPSREEVKEALALLRKSREAEAAAKPTKSKKAPAKQVDLDALFSTSEGANGDS